MRYISFILIILLSCSFLIAGVIEEKRSVVDFPKLGTYQATTKLKLDGMKKREDVDAITEGKGFFSNIIASMMPNGITGKIYNLDNKTLTNLNMGKKTYSIRNIEKLVKEENEEDYEKETVEEQDVIEDEPQYKIIRHKFEIEKKEKKEVNNFNTTHYTILYLMEKEEIETQKRLIDSLFVDLFATEDDAVFIKAQKEKNAFNSEYMKVIGLTNENKNYDELLGLSWLNMLQNMDQNSNAQEVNVDYNQFKKITGTPIIVDGTYYNKIIENNPKPKPKKKKKSFGFGSLTKALENKVAGAIENKVNGNNNSGIYKKIMGYRIETIAIKMGSVSANAFKTPPDFKEIIIPGSQRD